MSVTLPQDALSWLVDEGFAEASDTGWVRISSAPTCSTRPRTTDKVRAAERRDLHTFVKAIKTLGACSTGNGRIEVSTGCEGDEILFRLRQ